MSNYFSLAYARLLLSLTLLAAIIALLSYAHALMNEAKPYQATISVSGEGEVLAVPDIGQFSFSVNAEGETAAAAQEASGTKINDIMAYLREAGIEERDIKTRNDNLYPRYRYEQRICPPNSFCPAGERVQDGFEVTQSVTVKVRETDKAGAIIAGVGERGATNISSLSFTIDDTDAVVAEARAKAIADAKAEAQVLANQLGVRLGRIVSFNEGGNFPQPYNSRMDVMEAASMDASGFGGAELPMGEETTTARVQIVYEIE
jgi:uncharacterized protein YggE